MKHQWKPDCPECGKTVQKIKEDEEDENSDDGYVTVSNPSVVKPDGSVVNHKWSNETHRFYHKKCLEKASVTRGNLSDLSLKELVYQLADGKEYSYIGSRYDMNH